MSTTQMWMVRGRMSAPYGGVEMVNSASVGAESFGAGSVAEVVARFEAVQSGRQTVVGGFIFTPYTTSQVVAVESISRPSSASVQQVI